MKKKGFTLIELVIVIVILGILAAIALPKYVDLVGDAKKAATKAGLGAIRSVIAIKYSQRVANETSGTQPYSFSISTTDFFDNTLPSNKVAFGYTALATLTSDAADPATNATNGSNGWWAAVNTTATSGSQLGQAGAYSDGTVDTSTGW